MIDAAAPTGASVLDAVFGRHPLQERREAARDPLQDAREGDRADLSPLAGALARPGSAVALLEFNYQSVRAISESRSGGSVTRTEFLYESFEMNLTVAGDPEAAEALFERLKGEFTPEKVAERIAGFGRAAFGGREGVLEAARQGFQEALGLLGALDPEVRSELERTMELLKERLEAPEEGEDRNPLALNA